MSLDGGPQKAKVVALEKIFQGDGKAKIPKAKSIVEDTLSKEQQILQRLLTIGKGDGDREDQAI